MAGCLASTNPVAAATFTPIRVNAGGQAYVDGLGRTWSADTGATGGSPQSSTVPIHGTADSKLYQTCRQGASFTYSFKVPNGSYKVNLKFAEPWFTEAGGRKFDVKINGQRVLASFDAVTAAGARFVAVDREFPSMVSNGILAIDFLAVAASPIVSAIEITEQTAVSLTPTAVSLTGGQRQQFTAAGAQVKWSVQPAIGFIDAAGLYTAPATVGSRQVVNVTATNKTKSGDSASALMILVPGGPIRINAGGPAYTDSLGQVWSACSGGTGGSATQTTSAIAGTTAAPIYQTARQGEALGYQFAVGNGSYTVNLKFAEHYYTTAGSRVFDVTINGKTVLGKFDIVAQSGARLKAIDRSFAVDAPDGQITVQLYPYASSPMLNGIEILPAETGDTIPPAVSIASPANNLTVSGSITITASATDNVSVKSLQFKVDGTNLGSALAASPYSAALDTRTLANGPHTITAVASDAAGNTTTSTGVTISVSNNAVLDAQAPSVPAGLRATAASPSQIDLLWSASTDNVGVAGYRIFRGGVQIATATTTAYSDRGLTAATSYVYSVGAYDGAGNTSALSAAASATTAAAPTGTTVSRYDVFEQPFTWASTGYSNPWQQVTATMTLTSPNGRTTTVGGFYFAQDTWKARFAPAETGNWTWKATIGDGSKSQQLNGAFTVVDSNWPGFVRQSSANKFRWAFDNGSPYHALGIGDCISTGLDDMTMDTATVNGSTYFAAFQAAGVNLFRWSVDNCSYKLWNVIAESGNSYLAPEGQAGDNLVRLLRQNNIRTYMVIFGNAIPFGSNPTTAQLEAVKRYVKYIVDRYGAYVDFWELMNETTVSATWYDQVSQYLRSVDPYQHPISTSWEQPLQQRIEVVSPHWYQSEPDSEIDLYPAWKFRDWKASGKPVIVGEQGNATCNWDAGSAQRLRVRSWASFFSEGTLIFWHTGYSKSYCYNPANIYLGPEERGYLKVLQDFTKGFPAGAALTGTMSGSSGTLPVSDLSRVRAYGLTSPTAYAAYLHAYTNHTSPTTGITLTVAPQTAGVATWYSPATGQVLGTRNVNAGSQPLAVPAFTTDIALKIVPATQTACSFSIDPASGSAAADGNSGTVSVTSAAGCAWTASSNTSWLSITSGTSGSGGGPVGYTVSPNTGNTSRTGTLTVAGQTFTVTEAGAAALPVCSYSISPSSATAPAGGASGTAAVAAAAGCSWTATSNASWLSITSGATGTGNGSVGYAAAANSGTTARTGTLTAGGQTFTVTQAAAAAAAIAPTFLSALPAPGPDVATSIAAAAPGDTFAPQLTGATPGPLAPVIAAWNETALPDEGVTLTGTRFTSRTGADAGTDTVAWIWAANSTGGVLKQAHVWKATESLLTVSIPADVPSGMYLLWVENAGGASAPIAINQTKAQWLGPLGNIAPPGSRKRVFGRNLSNAHGTATSYVYVQPTAGGPLTPATATAVTPYSVEFTVPSAPGDYNVYVHNGHGGQYGWSQPLRLTVAAKWVRDTNEIIVNPSGSDDYAAIQNAINTQGGKANGGVVRLLAGNYVIKDMLSLGAKVKLAGAGKDATTVEIRLNAGKPSGLMLNGEKAELEGLTLKLFNSGGMPSYGIMNTGTAPNMLADVRISDVRWTADLAAYNSSNDMNVWLSRGEIVNSESFRELRVVGSADVWIHNSSFHGGPFKAVNDGSEGAISADNVSRIVIESNFFSTPVYTRTPQPSTVSARRVFNGSVNAGNVEQIYLGDNTSQDVAPLVADENKGEMILFHGGPAAWYGQAISSTATTVTVRTDGLVDGRALKLYNFNDFGAYSGPITEPLNQVRPWGLAVDGRMYAVIAGGTGIGQIRKVVGHTANSITVDQPWRVPPSSDSKLVLSYVYKDNIVYNNQLNAYPVGQYATYSANNMIQIDANAWGNITEGNVGQRTFVARVLGAHDLGMSAWNEFRNDKAYNVQRAGIQIPMWHNLTDTQVYPGTTIDLIGPATLGNAIRGGEIQVTGPAYNFFSVQLHQNSTYLGSWTQNSVNSPMQFHIGNIIEGVKSSGGRRGIGAGDWSETLYRNNSVTVESASVVPSNDIAPQGVYVRRFGSPILGGNNTYAGAATTYVKEANCAFGARLIPLNREALLQAAAGGTAAVAVPIVNAGTDGATWTVSSPQKWITANLPAGGTLAPEASGTLSVNGSASGMAPGVYQGTVVLSSGTNTVNIGVRMEVR